LLGAQLGFGGQPVFLPIAERSTSRDPALVGAFSDFAWVRLGGCDGAALLGWHAELRWLRLVLQL
jgi:hypothetical protein